MKRAQTWPEAQAGMFNSRPMCRACHANAPSPHNKCSGFDTTHDPVAGEEQCYYCGKPTTDLRWISGHGLTAMTVDTLPPLPTRHEQLVDLLALRKELNVSDEFASGYQAQVAWLDKENPDITLTKQVLRSRYDSLEPCEFNDGGTSATEDWLKRLEET